MLVTDGGQLIRVPVQDISIMGRSTQGVIVFSTAEGERVVSVEHIPDENGGEGEDEVRRRGARVAPVRHAEAAILRRAYVPLISIKDRAAGERAASAGKSRNIARFRSE